MMILISKKAVVTILRIIFGVSFLVLVLSDCGGGFKTNSPNAAPIEKSIFGGDTLR